MKKIFILLFLILLIAGGYYAYPIIKNRYFSNVSKPKQTQEQESLEKINSQSTSLEENIDESENNNQVSDSKNDTLNFSESEKKFLSGEKTENADSKTIIDVNERNVADGKTLAHITTEHCDNECAAFSLSLELLEYCQQVCGIAPIKTVSSCDNKTIIEKDYCLKDLAITKNDSSLCENIADANIKLTCKNRILQDIIENQ